MSPELSYTLRKVASPCSEPRAPRQVLASVMTCANYLKLPDYSTFEVRRQHVLRSGDGETTIITETRECSVEIRTRKQPASRGGGKSHAALRNLPGAGAACRQVLRDRLGFAVQEGQHAFLLS